VVRFLAQTMFDAIMNNPNRKNETHKKWTFAFVSIILLAMEAAIGPRIYRELLRTVKRLPKASQQYYREHLKQVCTA
jgi:hypothetical protein